uniref:Uncharacterized protein n=1 Tax=Arundo donax TaxID=35708 RepID=A0A0A9B3E3_ARUDO
MYLPESFLILFTTVCQILLFCQ